MTDDLTRLEEKIDALLDALPAIDALASLLIPMPVAVERTGLHRNTLDRKSVYNEVGKRKSYIEVREIQAVKRRKKRT